MRAPRKLPNLANPMMQAALQRHALLLLTGAKWGQFFEVSINQLLSSTIVFAWALLDFQWPGDLVVWLAANA
jgi:hypothetical protein